MPSLTRAVCTRADRLGMVGDRVGNGSAMARADSETGANLKLGS